MKGDKELEISNTRQVKLVRHRIKLIVDCSSFHKINVLMAHPETYIHTHIY